MNKSTLITLIGLIGLICLVPRHLNSHVYDEDGEFAHPAINEDAYATDDRYGHTIGFVYVRVSATAHYKFPMATGLHSAFIQNDSGGHLPEWPKKLKGLRFYCDFYSDISGPNWFKDSDTWHDEGFLDSYWSNDPNDRPGYWWVSNEHLDFDLTNEVWGEYTLESESVVQAKYDIDGDGSREGETWRAEAILENFAHREEPMGIDDW